MIWTMMNILARKIVHILSSEPKVKLAYLFGSRARGTTGPMSDYDFAVYIDEPRDRKRFEIKLDITTKLSRFLKTDDVDVVSISDAKSPELKYAIIKEGKLLYEKEPFKVIVEPRIMSEYFDFRDSLQKYGLTRT